MIQICKAEALEIPDPSPTHSYTCWNCRAPINNVENQHAGFDETGSLGHICNSCGCHLGHLNNPQKHYQLWERGA